jgi:inner membrane protein
MPTVVSHAIAGAALAATAPSVRGRLWLAGAVCATIPDLDVLGIWVGVPWRHVLGHRGLTHSLAFAAGLATLVTVAAFRGRGWRAAWLALFVATASHGVLDAMTSGGPGVALLAPFDDTRYFLPWRPIPVAPLGVAWLLTPRARAVFEAEIVVVWLPAAALALVVAARRVRRRRA